MFASEHGPPEPSTRLVLFALALHMNQQGANCFPSQTLIAKRTGLSERSVRTHLANAVREGWLAVGEKHRPGKKAWFVSEYTALIPADLIEHIPAKPWDEDPDYRRPAKSAGRASEPAHQAPRDIQRPRRAANGAARPAIGTGEAANGAVTGGNPFLHARQGLPTNSSSNSSRNPSENSSSERAALRAARPAEDGLKKPVRKKSDAERRQEAIVRIHTALKNPEIAKWTDADVAKTAAVTVDEVRRARAAT